MKKSITPVLILLVVFILSQGCTKRTGQPIPKDIKIDKLTIVNNPKVIVHDFVDVITKRFEKNNIPCVFVNNENEIKTKYALWYSARQTWDLKLFLSHADLDIYDVTQSPKKLISNGKFHLVGKGGLSPKKWASTAYKMDPLVDYMVTGVMPDAKAAKGEAKK